MQEDLNKLVPSASLEVDELNRLAADLSPEAFISLKRSILQRYISDFDVIENILKVNSHTWEVASIIKLEKEDWFKEGLAFLIEAFRLSKRERKADLIDLLESGYPSIHEALNSYHDAFFLLNINEKSKLRHFARSCFRQMGDSIEATHKPYIELISNLVAIYRNLDGSHKKTSFGGNVSRLTEVDLFRKIYVDRLNGVPINQWRNICQHSSYQTIPESNQVKCDYGKDKEIILDKNEILFLMSRLDQLHTLHKIAIDFMVLDLSSELDLGVNLGMISMETIIGDLCSTLSTLQYPITEIKNEKKKLKISVVDRQGAGKKGLQYAMTQVSMLLIMLHKKGFSPIFGLYSKSGTKITEARLGGEFA
ncbi:MAG: hypothetical protein RI567_10585 [Marinobacter sp.]|nr:hypothetical protein [Marinobacter sp.]